jgi:hypothetical protein
MKRLECLFFAPRIQREASVQPQKCESDRRYFPPRVGF